jgi:hypothetical protein
VVFGETDEPGLYRVLLRTRGGERPAGRFAVNLFQPGESRLLPAPSLRLGQTTVEQPENGENVGQHELWPWLAALAVLVLFVEWWVHYRGDPAALVRLETRSVSHEPRPCGCWR